MSTAGIVWLCILELAAGSFTYQMKKNALEERYDLKTGDLRPFIAGVFWPITWVIAICKGFANFLWDC